MDRTTIIGMLLGVTAIGAGMIMKGVSVEALFNPAAFLIIIAGTIASVLIAFPASAIRNVPHLFKVIFSNHHQIDIGELIRHITLLAEQTRREGLLSLESKMDEMEDPFLIHGLQLAVDGQNSDFIRDVLLEKIRAMEERHEEGARVFSQAGTYAPTLGVLGAVVGLVAALGSMDKMEVLGAAISSAFIATLLGIFSGYVLWHPFANKLREKTRQEVRIKEIMMEGILSITAGESPAVIKDKLSSYLPAREIAKMERKAQIEMKQGEGYVEAEEN